MDAEGNDIAKHMALLDLLLKRHSTRPVPDYLGFLQAVSDEPQFTNSSPSFFTSVALFKGKYEILMQEDAEAEKASDVGVEAYLRYKLLVRFEQELEEKFVDYIEAAKSTFPREVLESLPNPSPH